MTMRLDIFLKNTGLIKQRSEAKRACDAGRVQIGGQPAKASHLVIIGEQITVETDVRLLDFEVLSVPARPPAKRDRHRCYRIIRDEHRDPYDDLSF